MNKFLKHLLSIGPVRISEEPICNSIGLEYKPTKRKITIASLTGRAEHEAAHIIEMQNWERLKLIDFGLPSKSLDELTSNGLLCSLAREARTRGIQENFDLNYSVHETLIEVINFLFENEKRLPIGKFKTVQEVKEWYLSIANHSKKIYSKDKIENEWKDKMEYLQNWRNSPDEYEIQIKFSHDYDREFFFDKLETAEENIRRLETHKQFIFELMEVMKIIDPYQLPFEKGCKSKVEKIEDKYRKEKWYHPKERRKTVNLKADNGSIISMHAPWAPNQINSIQLICH